MSHPLATASYLRLVKKFPLVSIQSHEQLAEASRVMEDVLRLGEGDQGVVEYLDALSDLIWAYEEEHFPMRDPSVPQMLAYLMETKGVTQAKVAEDTGLQKSMISEVLSGKRTIGLKIMGRLATYFHVSPAVFVPGEEKRKAKPPAKPGSKKGRKSAEKKVGGSPKEPRLSTRTTAARS